MAGKNSYHHGDLRQSLLSEATTMIAETGVEKLSMRSLAERVGVSRTAAYHHFKDKNDLLCAIAEQGFNSWQQHFSALLTRPPVDLKQWFRQFVQVYIDFAREHAEQYDLMFARAIWKTGEPTHSLQEVSTKCFQGYVEYIEYWQSQGLISKEVEALRVAQVTWSTMHGLSRLLNDGIYLEGKAVDSICESMVNLTVPGFIQANGDE